MMHKSIIDFCGFSTSDSSDLSVDEFSQETEQQQNSKNEIVTDLYDRGIEDLFSAHVSSITRCQTCGNTNVRPNISMLTCLAYPNGKCMLLD